MDELAYKVSYMALGQVYVVTGLTKRSVMDLLASTETLVLTVELLWK